MRVCPSLTEFPLRILVDCTRTARTSATTGIQRVVRELVRAGLEGATPGADWVAVRFRGGSYRALPGAEFRRTMLRSVETPRARARWADAARQRARAIASDAPRGLHDAIGRTRARLSAVLSRAGTYLPSGRGPVLDYRPGDWVFLADTHWSVDTVEELVRAKASGAAVAVLVYDLIKIDRPDLVPPGSSIIFSRWLEAVLPHADIVLAISGTVRNDMLRYLSSRKNVAHLAVASVRLGSDFAPGAPAATSPEVAAVFADRGSPTFLCVGSVEPRKAHAIVLDAFEQRWRAGDPSRLVVIGREGWGCAELARRLRTHPERGHRLFWFDRATDADVSCAYLGADAVVCASLAEGFGLPVVEALARGTPVIASDIPVFREVAGEDATFFRPGDSSALADALDRASRGQLASPGQRSKLRFTWSLAAEDVVARLRGASSSRPGSGAF